MIDKDTIIKNLKSRVVDLENKLKILQVPAKVVGKMCPACGSENISTRKDESKISVPFGPEVSYKVVVDTCGDCKEEGEFAPSGSCDNDYNCEVALEASTTQSVENMLSLLKDKGIKEPYLKRALRLDMVEDFYDMGAIVLLRFICTFPWLLEVSDSNFQTINVDMLRKEWRNYCE